ncbi:MAG TPA: preprotein translocase subunit SecA [Terriglobales bacterium]|nr:preprotein translocase subunit SecA [Terriglobales bacterium]
MGEKTFGKIFGTKNDRELKKLTPVIQQINALEPDIQRLSDDDLRAKTDEFRRRIADAVNAIPDEPEAEIERRREIDQERRRAEDEVLDEILPEAFAIVREAGRRILNMRHFDVQLIGGMVLHNGKIAEMKTGEGKTLVATLPVYLNALTGRGVHVVTVNDYLAKRDSEWMGKLYTFLGLTVGVIVHDLDDDERREAYGADITYGTNNEFGFDYLRDNMKFDLKDCVQRGHNFGIVDEVDSILIDEARTPLIISGASEESTDKYFRVNRIIPKLEKGEEIELSIEEKKLTGDFVVDEKHKTITVTDEGWEKVEQLLGIGNIADPENWDLKHHVETAVKAHALYRKDVEYVVKDGEVIIVDEFTGRLMPGRRWSDGLHQAIEAKENVKVERENQTLATITFQNYFRMYRKLAGMTGTAETEKDEFEKIYNLDVMVIPTNRPLLRVENPDIVYRTEKEKYYAAADEIAALNQKGQPVLVGTTSIEKSERLSELLKKKRIPHVVLNAKFHEKEAEIVAQAGRKGQVVIATNMAGRGTDILLGGNAEFMAKQELVKKGIAQPVEREVGGALELSVEDEKFTRFYYSNTEYQVPVEQWEEAFARYRAETDVEHDEVIQAGGLFILGTERHEARRIDNQLRGRAGRQGDPGASRFYLSLEDDLMRVFMKDWISGFLQKLGMEEGVPIESRMISNRIQKAQEAVEAQNFEARKHLLEYDDVMNKQREAVYSLRRQLLEGLDQKELILEDYVADILSGLMDKHAPKETHPEDWNIQGLKNDVFTRFGVDFLAEGVKPEQLNRQELGDAVFEKLQQRYDAKERLIGPDAMRYHERMIMLSVLDSQWKDHLLNMDHLKEGIGLRGYGQHDPLVEYKRESFDMFEAMMEHFEEETVRYLYLMQVIGREEAEQMRRAQEEGGAPVPAAGGDGNGQRPARRAATTIDELEESFQRRKKRELEQARMAGAGDLQPVQQVRRSAAKVGRNDACPCGSGKKYKKCCGVNA